MGRKERTLIFAALALGSVRDWRRSWGLAVEVGEGVLSLPVGLR